MRIEALVGSSLAIGKLVEVKNAPLLAEVRAQAANVKSRLSALWGEIVKREEAISEVRGADIEENLSSGSLSSAQLSSVNLRSRFSAECARFETRIERELSALRSRSERLSRELGEKILHASRIKERIDAGKTLVERGKAMIRSAAESVETVEQEERRVAPAAFGTARPRRKSV